MSVASIQARIEQYKENKPLKADIPVFSELAYRQGKYTNASLFRFRGVIRDVHDPEFVVKTTENEDSTMEMMSNHNKFIERIPLVIAPLSVTTRWSREAFEGEQVHSGNYLCDIASTTINNKKRSQEETAANQTIAISSSDENSCTNSNKDSSSKKKPKSSEEDIKNVDSDATSLPQIQEKEKCVNIYIYNDGNSSEAYKVNESFEFIVVLDLSVVGSENSSQATITDGTIDEQLLKDLSISECFDALERKERPGTVLHCCDAIPLDMIHHIHPNESNSFYMTVQENSGKKTACINEWKKLGLKQDIADMRNILLDHLTLLLKGDRLAAEYLLLSLLSRVYGRVDLTTPLGNLSLNLMVGKSLDSNQAKINSFVKSLEKELQRLMPLFSLVSLSIENLNKSSFIPIKDYERNTLTSGALQVPHGTTLLLDETQLTAGQLDDSGVRNVAALTSLITKMVLPYDFRYFNMEFPQDNIIISVSETKSILPATVSLPVEFNQTSPDVGIDQDDEDVSSHISAFRIYLGILRSFEVQIGNEQAELAEKHFVTCRKAKKEVNSEDLHRWLRIARLISVSLGEENLSIIAWEHMLELESQRQERLLHYMPPQATTTSKKP